LIYADGGRVSIAPENLLRAPLLQVFYSVRSEHMLMASMRLNPLFRLLVGLATEDAVWDHSLFSKNCYRLLGQDIVEAFFTGVMSLADERVLVARDHFSVDGTLIQVWASHQSFRAKDGSGAGTSGKRRTQCQRRLQGQAAQ